MNFLADESFDYPIVDALRKNGYNVYSIFENSQGIPDDEVLKTAKEQNRILLTVDKDFGELAFRLKLISCGIVLLRTPEFTIEQKVASILECIEVLGDRLSGSFCVITDKKVRIIPLVA